MKRLLIASLCFVLPLTAFAVPETKEQREKLGRELSLPCSEYGEESCIARFLAMKLVHLYLVLILVNLLKKQ